MSVRTHDWDIVHRKRFTGAGRINLPPLPGIVSGDIRAVKDFFGSRKRQTLDSSDTHTDMAPNGEKR